MILYLNEKISNTKKKTIYNRYSYERRNIVQLICVKQTIYILFLLQIIFK